jgi:lysophospholipase L1-like esterase
MISPKKVLKLNKKIIFFSSILVAMIIFLLLFSKITDYILNKKYGLGNLVLYENSIITGYNLSSNQKITNRRNNKIIINDKGMRSSNNWEVSSLRKILFIGDSVTYGGSVVSNNQTFSEKICSKLNKNKEEFLCGNYAVNGYSIISMKNKIEYKDFNDEEFIIIVLTASDLERNFHNLYSQPFFSKKIENYFPALTEVIFIYLEKFMWEKKYKKNSMELKINTDTYKKFAKKNIVELAKTATATKKKIMLVYSPEKTEIYNQNKFFYYKNILKDNFSNFLDMTDYIINENNLHKIYSDNIHLNADGHEFYSSVIKDYLINKFTNIK